MPNKNNNNSLDDPRLTWETLWQTRMGAWFPGETVLVRGKDLFKELGDVSWMGYWLHAITGKVPTPAALTIYEAIWTLMASYPEPRLWNNRIATLAASARSTSCLGVSGGIAVSDATVYGLRPVYAIGVMLTELLAELAAGKPLTDLLQARLAKPVAGVSGAGANRQIASIPGYGRPIANRDERIAPMFALLEKVGLANSPCMKLIVDIETTLKTQLNVNWTMNAAAFVVAFTLDQGLTPKQSYQYMTLCFSAGILACYIDAETHPPGAFFPMRCDSIVYRGVAPRAW